MTAPSPAPGLEECDAWVERIVSAGKQGGYIRREGNVAIRVASEDWLRAILRHAWVGGSLRPAQPSPATLRKCSKCGQSDDECDGYSCAAPAQPSLQTIPDAMQTPPAKERARAERVAQPAQTVSELPDYVERIERTMIAANIAPFMDDWARVRFDLRELAALRAASTASTESATVSPPASGLSEARFAWLIERQIGGRAAWRSMTSFKPEAGWTHDANEAMQFSRDKDVIDFMAADCGDGEIYVATATEHGFHSLSTLGERDVSAVKMPEWPRRNQYMPAPENLVSLDAMSNAPSASPGKRARGRR